MADRTPGPWKAVYVGCSDWDLDGPTTKEDWTLAAAAPDLLAALQVILRDYMAVHDIGDVEMQPAIYQARAALARAGEKT
jgi:hypothetical protein